MWDVTSHGLGDTIDFTCSFYSTRLFISCFLCIIDSGISFEYVNESKYVYDTMGA